jgi:integrase/recombinase XerC
MRHAFATHLLKSIAATGGDGLREIQTLLGHSSVSTTAQYLQLDLTDLQKVYDRCHPHAGVPVPVPAWKAPVAVEAG